MATFEGPAPQQKIKGADKVLQSALIKTDSGNIAIVTVAVTGLRAIVNMNWKRPPSASEQEEVWELLHEMGMPKPDKVQVAKTAEEAQTWANDYLKKGKQ